MAVGRLLLFPLGRREICHGALQERLRRVAVLRKTGDSDAHCYGLRFLVTAAEDGDLGQAGQQPGGGRDRRGAVRLRQQHGEIVVLDAGDELRRRDGLGQRGGDHAEEPVTQGLTVAGVELSEVIDVQQHQRETLSIASSAHHLALQHLLEVTAVVHPGDWIDIAEPDRFIAHQQVSQGQRQMADQQLQRFDVTFVPVEREDDQAQGFALHHHGHEGELAHL